MVTFNKIIVGNSLISTPAGINITVGHQPLAEQNSDMAVH